MYVQFLKLDILCVTFKQQLQFILSLRMLVVFSVMLVVKLLLSICTCHACYTHLEPLSRKQACLGFFQIRFRLKTFREILNSRYPFIFFGWFLSCPKMRQKFAIVTPKSCLLPNDPNVLWIDFQQLCKKKSIEESIKSPLCVLKFSSWIFTEFCFFKKSTSCVQCAPWIFSTERCMVLTYL